MITIQTSSLSCLKFLASWSVSIVGGKGLVALTRFLAGFFFVYRNRFKIEIRVYFTATPVTYDKIYLSTVANIETSTFKSFARVAGRTKYYSPFQCSHLYSRHEHYSHSTLIFFLAAFVIIKTSCDKKFERHAQNDYARALNAKPVTLDINAASSISRRLVRHGWRCLYALRHCY